jgi:hypothetical protein
VQGYQIAKCATTDDEGDTGKTTYAITLDALEVARLDAWITTLKVNDNDTAWKLKEVMRILRYE